MKKSILLTIALLTCFSAMAQERFVVRIPAPKPDVLTEFLKAGYDMASFSPGNYIDLVVDQPTFQKLKDRGFSMTVTQTESQLKNNMIAGKTLAGYRTYADLYTELLAIQAAHPAICKLYDIGESRGKEYSGSAYANYKHEIWAMKISDNVETEEDEPCIFYMAEHHAREPISLEVAMYILNYIVNNYGVDPAITSSVNNKQIWFMPLVNPNGHKIVLDETDVWWRKNIRDNNSNSTIDAGTTDGVDLNRNYGWEWAGAGTSTDPTDITYCGPAGFSEPEVTAMKNMIDQHHFVAGITYHSYSELVLYPYGYTTDAIAPDNTSLQALAISMAGTIPAAGGGYYTPEKSSALYPASGTTDDYAYGQRGVFCYTIEIGTEFIPPASGIAAICANNLQAAKILLNRVDQSTLTGNVKDAVTQLPLQAKVYIQGIDNTGSYRVPYTSDAAFGRYYRLLPDGNYTVTFSLYGYITQTFGNVNINSSGRTILNVSLVPAQAVTITGTVTELSGALPIQNAAIQVLNTPLAAVYTNTAGQYSMSNVMEGAYTISVSKAGYSTILQQAAVSQANSVFDFQMQPSTAWGFESGTFEPQWAFSGNAPWTITTELPYEGLYCARSGAISDNQSSVMSIELYITSAGQVSFFRKVSSESGYDFLKFFIDDVQQGLWSGTVPWGEVTYPVTAGLHTFKWSYIKDTYTIGGSDRAWVDYINFPPYGPVPAPPNISLSPTAFTKSLTTGNTTSDILTIANTGDQPLTYTAQAVYSAGGGSPATVWPLNANYNTGSTTSSAKSQVSLVKGYPTTEAGWMKFDISGIPDGATINSVEFHGYVNATNYPYWNINPVTADPVTASAATLYSDIIAESSTGYYLYRSEASNYTTGWKVHTLGGNANANLQAALVQDWFAIGIMDRDNSSSYYIGFDGWSQANKPYLVVSYTYTPPYSWLTVNGTSSVSGTVPPGTSQELTAGFQSGTLATGIYTAGISVSSNDPDAPSVQVPCTLNVVTGTTLNLTLFLEGLYTGPGTMRKAQNASGNHFPGTTADQVTVELHTAADYNVIACTLPGANLSVTGTASVIIPPSVTGSCYITIRHRNSMETTSALPVSIPGSGNVSYNFTTAASQAWGANMTNLGSAWGFFAGDNNQDGAVDAADMIQVGNDKATGVTGYTATDLDGDGTVNNADLQLQQANASLFVRKRNP